MENTEDKRKIEEGNRIDNLQECPGCGASIGWVAQENKNISIGSDGKVSIGFGGHRFGDQIECRCNNPDCDEVVIIYIKSVVTATSEIEPTGAKAALDSLREKNLLPRVAQVRCEGCKNEFYTDITGKIDKEGALQLVGSTYCGACGDETRRKTASIFKSFQATIDTEELEEFLEDLKDVEEVEA